MANYIHGPISKQVYHKGVFSAHGCILGSRVYPLLFFIYLNDLSEGPATNASYVSLFSVVDNMNLSGNNLSS